MFESPVKQNLQSSEGTRRLIIYSVLLVLAREHDLSHSANAVSARNCNPLLFSALALGAPCEFLGKLY